MTDEAFDAEACVLAAMLLEPKAISIAATMLLAEDFNRVQHARIFSAMIAIFSRGDDLDLVTLSAELRDRSELELIGGPYALSELLSWTATAGNVEQHARIVQEKSALRKIRRSATEAGQQIDIGDGPKPIAERLQQRLLEIQAERATDRTSAGELTPATVRYISDLAENKPRAVGLKTGFPALDAIIGGLKPGNLIVLAGRPSMGKTALALNIAHNVASLGAQVGIISLEMRALELSMRFACARAEVSQNEIRPGISDESLKRVLHAAAENGNLPITLWDASTMTVLDALSRCVGLHVQQKLDLVIVDYLQLISAANTRENRTEQLSEITRALKAMSRRLNAPVIALSQLNRALEGRPERRPQLSDLRGSGAIEQDADQVLFVFREELHKPNEPTLRGRAEIIVAKNRNGPIGDVRLKFVHELAKFVEADEWTAPRQIEW